MFAHNCAVIDSFTMDMFASEKSQIMRLRKVFFVLRLTKRSKDAIDCNQLSPFVSNSSVFNITSSLECYFRFFTTLLVIWPRGVEWRTHGGSH